MFRLMTTAVLAATFSFQAQALYSATSGVYTPPVVQALPLPLGVSFESERVRVLNSAWFNVLFESAGCEFTLGTQDLNLPLKLHAEDGAMMLMKLDGKLSKLTRDADTLYYPVHYFRGNVVHPYFVMKAKNWVSFKIEIDKDSAGVKKLRVYLIKGRPGSEKLVPVLEAEGR